MDLEQIVYSLPSSQTFFRGVTDVGTNGVKIVLLPDNLSREMAGRLIRNAIVSQRLSVSSLFEPGEGSPAIASAQAMNVSWPTSRTLRNVENLLRCENLPTVFYVERIGDRTQWVEFIEGWAREYSVLRNSQNQTAPMLCIVAKLRDFDSALPTSSRGLSFHWWWGFPSALEMRLACRIATQRYGDDDAQAAQWREYVIPGLVGSDVQLGGHMWTYVLAGTDHAITGLRDYWDHLEQQEAVGSVEEVNQRIGSAREEFAIGEELPEGLRSLWASGLLVYSPEYGLEIHPAFLAHRDQRTGVEHRLWRGQSELLLPFVNEIRLRVCEEMTSTYGHDWPIRWVPPSNEHETEEVKRSPLGTELGHINYLLQSLGISNPRHDLYQKRSLGDLVLQSKNVRNEIAHYSPILFKTFATLCAERKKTGF